MVADGPAPGSSTPAEMAERQHDFLSVWEEYRMEAEEYRELDGERVLVLMRQHGRGKTSGLELGQLWTKGVSLFHVRDGKVTRHIFYYDRQHALADLGLAPEAGLTDA